MHQKEWRSMQLLFWIFLVISLFKDSVSYSKYKSKAKSKLLARQYDMFPVPPYCGVDKRLQQKIDYRIFGGTEVIPHRLPWMVELSTGCGGALINSRWVLSAGHCSKIYLGSLPKINLGANKCERLYNGTRLLNVTCDLGVSSVEVQQMIPHEEFWVNKTMIRNDIMLLQLKRPVTYTKDIQPICLPHSIRFIDDIIVEKFAQVSGWGKTENGVSKYLRKADVQVWSSDQCMEFAKLKIGPNFICAGGVKGRDACQGDSGAPLSIRLPHVKRGRAYLSYYQIGIVSSGLDCARKGYPGLYTNVTAYIPWIRKTILENE